MGERFYLLFRKPRVGRELARGHHGIFREHIQRRVLPVFFDRQDSGHIGQGNMPVILQQVTQIIQVLRLSVFIVRTLPEYRVPFIYDDNCLSVFRCINIVNRLDQVGIAHELNIRICPLKVSDDYLLHIGERFIYRDSSLKKSRHHKMDHIKFPEKLVPACSLSYFSFFKQLAAVSFSIVVGADHIRRHCFAESARAGDTDKTLLRIHNAVYILYHLRLIDKDFRINSHLISRFPWIQISSHLKRLLRESVPLMPL